ncbi:MBL fold hydrolase [Clostridia bacterium]|nr:MBL fold hydrolase [Clostridia bacterium]
MFFQTLNVGKLRNNCYILSGDGANAVIIDPATEAAKIEAALMVARLAPTAVLLTHGHFDHHGAARRLQEAGAEIYLNKSDWVLIKKGMGFVLPKAFTPDHDLTDGQILTLAGLTIRVIATPGHTPGGVCFLFESINRPLLFSGDTLFHTDVGRTDFPGGDFATLKKSILEKLYTLPPETLVYPGHEEETTIGEEREHNTVVRAK